MINLLFTILVFNGITGKIQGIVTDEHTNEPIPYANVVVLNIEIGAATDNKGHFFILNAPPGRYTVEISCIGYQTKFIKDVIVEIEHTVRLKVSLKQTTIEIAPITVTSEKPVVKKDMVGTTYIVRKSELTYLPIDYSSHFVTFQPAVASADTAIHVRGGRATEVLYLIDNVSIIDPQTGDLAINLSRGIVDEVIFLPGGFDAEYGRAMSGVINMVTAYPSDNLHLDVYGKTETIMPFYYDFGYENFSSSAHLPISNRCKGVVSLDVMHTNDWNPKLYILPHKQRDDYSLYGKWLFVPSGKLKISLSGAKARTQFDRYTTLWKSWLDHYRSDMRESDLEVFNMSFLPNSRNLFNITISRLHTERIYGVTEENTYGYFDNFIFRDYATLEWPRASYNNPFGARHPDIIGEGDYPRYEDKSSLVVKTNINANLQIHNYHEIEAGAEYSYLDLKNFTYFVSDSLNQLIDDYRYFPKEYSVYIQNNIDYRGLYAKIGCRYDYFSSDIDGIEPKTTISPRLGFSFMVTDKFLFRTNVGRYTQPPLYDYMYGYYNLTPFPSYITAGGWLPLVGNPNLKPEKTMSYEIGLQGEIRKNLDVTVNAFYKDVSDLIGTKLVKALPHNYVSYYNVEYANVKGIETILEFTYPFFAGKIAYTLSYARGSSSYAQEVYYLYYYDDPDTSTTPALMEYYLDFDQRHRIFVQGTINLPLQTNMYLFGYFGEGFPYTLPGFEGKYEERNIERLPVQKRIDCVISKLFKIGKFSLEASLEIINLLDARYQIATAFPVIPLEDIKIEDFDHPPPYVDICNNTYYNPAADINHDGLITPLEEFTAYRALIESTEDWVNTYSAPRRARIGVSLSF